MFRGIRWFSIHNTYTRSHTTLFHNRSCISVSMHVQQEHFALYLCVQRVWLKYGQSFDIICCFAHIWLKYKIIKFPLSRSNAAKKSNHTTIDSIEMLTSEIKWEMKCESDQCFLSKNVTYACVCGVSVVVLPYWCEQEWRVCVCMRVGKRMNEQALRRNHSP